jgi:protein-disulfide isomerase
VEDYVEAGDVLLVFWPLLDLGQGSERSAVAAECVGRQDPALFWLMHRLLFERQADLYRAERDYFVNLAVEVGADQAAFEQCYDDGDALAMIRELDTLRRERGIVGRPTFDINGEVFSGLPSYEQFQAVIDASLDR